MLTVEANWEVPADDDANVNWAREVFADVQALPVASGRYGNFPGMNEDPAKLLSGENYDRLVDVKTTYDPDNLSGRTRTPRRAKPASDATVLPAGAERHRLPYAAGSD